MKEALEIPLSSFIFSFPCFFPSVRMKLLGVISTDWPLCTHFHCFFVSTLSRPYPLSDVSVGFIRARYRKSPPVPFSFPLPSPCLPPAICHLPLAAVPFLQGSHRHLSRKWSQAQCAFSFTAYSDSCMGARKQ